MVEEKLRESRARLESGIRAMNGNLACYVGIDQANNAMHNVSMWESVADANQMSTFAPMLALGKDFSKLGVRFDRPILNSARCGSSIKSEPSLDFTFSAAVGRRPAR